MTWPDFNDELYFVHMFDLKKDAKPSAEGAWIALEVALASLLPALVLGMLGPPGPEASPPLQVGTRHRGGLHHRHSRHPGSVVLMMLLFFWWPGAHQRDLHLGQRGTYNNHLLASNPEPGRVSLLPDCRTSARFGPGSPPSASSSAPYMTETFRSAILGGGQGELRRPRAFGMRRQVFVRILFPQMMRHTLPGFGNNWLVLLENHGPGLHHRAR